ncbi:hypothetical protein BgiMline_014593, partial [Biomphalaria glabrata]
NILTGITSLTDNNDATCNLISKTVSLNLDKWYPFTWMRLTFKFIESSSFYFKLLFKTSQLTLTECGSMQILQVNNKTLDVWCTLNETINQINISGDSMAYVCSVYVSG